MGACRRSLSSFRRRLRRIFIRFAVFCSSRNLSRTFVSFVSWSVFEQFSVRIITFSNCVVGFAGTEQSSVPFLRAPHSGSHGKTTLDSLSALNGLSLRLRGGALPFRYEDSWKDMTVRMPIEDGIKGRDVVYKLTP
eukprot:1243004-Rhodomonas_salina.1